MAKMCAPRLQLVVQARGGSRGALPPDAQHNSRAYRFSSAEYLNIGHLAVVFVLLSFVL